MAEVGGGKNQWAQVSRIESLGRPLTPEDVWNAAVRAGVDPVGQRAVGLADRLDQLGPAVEQPGAVVGGVAGRQRPVRDQ